MSDKGSERGSELSSDHTDWAFVDDNGSQDAGTASPGRCKSTDLGASVGAPEQIASASAPDEPERHAETSPMHNEPQNERVVSTPPASASCKRIVVAPRRSLSLSQSQMRAPRKLFATEGDPAEGDWHATKQYEEDIRRASSAFPKPKAPAHTHRHLKLLLVGEACVGKTTLAKNLFAAYCREGDPAVQDGPSTVQQFTEDPEAGCTDIEVQVQPEDSETVTSFHYCIQDTPPVNLPGAADSILYYIQKQSHQYLSNEDNPSRRRPVSSFVDCRVDACLYLVPPHSLKPSDVTLMASLSKIVPVIPLLAKADAMTTTELDGFRHHVQEQLAEAEEELGQPVMYTFSGAADAAAEDFEFKGFPLATIASGMMDESIGRFWPVRTFPWGKCEAMSSIHSDVSLLKSLLFENAYEDLKALTEARYYTYRDEAYATAAAARQALPDVRNGDGQAEDQVATPEAAQQPRRRFGWLKLKCSPWKVCAAVVVFALALSVDNLLLRREVGRQRGLHQMKNEVGLAAGSAWRDDVSGHYHCPSLAESAVPMPKQQHRPSSSLQEGSKGGCACQHLRPEPDSATLDGDVWDAATAKPNFETGSRASHGGGRSHRQGQHKRSHKQQRSAAADDGPKIADGHMRSWQQEAQELLWLPADEALPRVRKQIKDRLKGVRRQILQHGRRRVQQAAEQLRHLASL
ncbi:hypothetical protein WJX74_008536 [Apatococcus lobatus]|uniref:Septin-type G domain-containing protein n=1 Tax=Apatococcus lobatus TaxID=904363 RepID=A0AAW1R2K3_9CHLO